MNPVNTTTEAEVIRQKGEAERERLRQDREDTRQRRQHAHEIRLARLHVTAARQAGRPLTKHDLEEAERELAHEAEENRLDREHEITLVRLRHGVTNPPNGTK